MVAAVSGGLLAFLGGAALWTFSEYVLHRFAFHELRGRWMGSREHLNHHVRGNWIFDSTILLAWIGVLLVGAGWAALGALLWGIGPGIGLGLGWVVGYFTYEWHHAKAHLRAPRNSWERRLRKHHFHHHFGHPLANQGVIVPFWDVVFGTRESPDRVRVPRRLLQGWMVDESGELRPEFTDDYELVGGRAGAGPRPEDRVDAYSNRPPMA